VAYAFASIPSRYFLENKMWKEAAAIKLYPPNLPWNDFPWQKAIVHFTRIMGAVHTGKNDLAKAELDELNRIYNKLTEQKDSYQATQVEIQIKTAEAWILFKEGKNEALSLMNSAADLEDKTEKHPVTPGAVIPAREFLGNMLLDMNKPVEALAAYKADLKKNRNRFNGLYGAAIAAEKSNNNEKAKEYYKQLITIANSTSAERIELEKAKIYLKKNPD
jgi:tetratricopeptide (TPR) repeat protein